MLSYLFKFMMEVPSDGQQPLNVTSNYKKRSSVHNHSRKIDLYLDLLSIQTFKSNEKFICFLN
ncbi:hypothetical protein BpHYR1_019614 [Brachionus plicatilis]|uniref:Uncharacterized protein n=1 Tax=Brachionus plicatilis TaxID=10195 RepID=A0A3M7Q567_BRAPC|nr:hypothetical protein BpHYR1_019614 [Brachionus plicatilis]